MPLCSEWARNLPGADLAADLAGGRLRLGTSVKGDETVGHVNARRRRYLHPRRTCAPRERGDDPENREVARAGVDSNRIYTDKLSGMSTREQRPGLAALFNYCRRGDCITAIGIDRLGRNATEVMTAIRELRDGRDIVLRSLREGIDMYNATGRMVAGVLASLAECGCDVVSRFAAGMHPLRQLAAETDWST